MLNFIYAIISVIIVSLISLIGVFTLPFNDKKLKNILIYFISFSAGALLGDVFIHLIPELINEYSYSLNISLYILSGIAAGFLVEKIICWRHCHLPITRTHVHRLAYMNLFGDFIHNFIDGLSIGASYMVGIPVGIATTVAVVLHEIPQEIGDFGVLLHSGLTKTKAIYYNFLTATSAILGAVVVFAISNYVENLTAFLLSFAAGNFIYIAGADLIPELHKEEGAKKGFIQLAFFILGILIMMLLLLYEKN